MSMNTAAELFAAYIETLDTIFEGWPDLDFDSPIFKRVCASAELSLWSEYDEEEGVCEHAFFKFCKHARKAIVAFYGCEDCGDEQPGLNAPDILEKLADFDGEAEMVGVFKGTVDDLRNFAKEFASKNDNPHCIPAIHTPDNHYLIDDIIQIDGQPTLVGHAIF